ncbi:uncharacterized protein LOC115721687 [Cannabis sativa]|uniref:uncharacterized protein LOC115721687 n=1 Tax=Cannabis sativa TaxID=3483 RepID=UPI0029CA6B05|nr:uncharacterized protein LOC115721687 [Cannabis sativa]
MAEECAESSVAISTSAGVVSPSNWWDLHPTTAAAATAAAGSSALSSWCHHHHRNNNNTNTTTINNCRNIPWHNIHQAAAAIAPNPNSNSDEDVSISTSFTNASNHSGLTVESSRRLIEPAASSSDDLMAEQQTASDNHIWSHVLLNVGNNGELHNHNQDVGENFLDMLSSSSTKSNNNNSNNGMYEPLACDYLKKLDTNTNSAKYSNSWDDHNNHFSSSNNNNNFDDQKSNSTMMMMMINTSTTTTTPSTALINESMVENERLTNKLSNLISTWSIAPPDPLEININTTTTTNNNNNNHYFNPDDQTCNISLSSNSIMEDHHFPPCNYLLPSLKLENHSGHGDGDEMDEARPFNNNIMGYNNNNGSFMTSAGHYGMPGPGPGLGPGSMDSYSSCASNVKNFADVISFGGRLGKPFMDLHGSNNNNIKPCINKSLGLSDSKKQGLQTSTPTKGSGRGQGNTSSEGKKKRSDNQDNNSETSLKKPKQENSTASSAKIQVPKVKLGDRITALQQIVSPFGKTDTASVLYEAIQYIKFLQEQVKLLSNPYMKTNSHKDAWGSLDRNIKDHHHHQNQQNNQMMMVMKGDHHHHHQNHQNNHHVKLDLRSRGLCLVPLSCTPQVYRDNTGSDYWTPTYRGCLYR